MQCSLDTIMSVQPHKVKSLVELCTYALATQLLLGKRELKRATSNAKKALERRANYPTRREYLENEIMAKEKELEKLKKQLVDLTQSHDKAACEIVDAVKERDELSLSIMFLEENPDVVAAAEAICKDADEQHRQNLRTRQAAKENLDIKDREYKAFQTENSKSRQYPNNLAAIRNKTEVLSEDKRQLIHQFDVTVVNSELEVEKPLACDDVDDGVWLENTELYYRNIVAALKDCKNKANEHLEKCIIIVNAGVPFSKFGSSLK